MVATQTLKCPCLKGYFAAWRSLELGAQRWKVTAWCPNDRETSERRKPRTIYCSGSGSLALCCCRDEKEMSQKKKFEVKRVNQNVICRPSSQSTGTREQGNKGKHDDQTNETLISVTARNFQKHICGGKNKNKQKKTKNIDSRHNFLFSRPYFPWFPYKRMNAEWLNRRYDQTKTRRFCLFAAMFWDFADAPCGTTWAMPSHKFTHWGIHVIAPSSRDKSESRRRWEEKGRADLNPKQSYSKWTRPSRPTLLKCLGSSQLLSLQGPLCSKCVSLRSNFHWL